MDQLLCSQEALGGVLHLTPMLKSCMMEPRGELNSCQGITILGL